MRTLQEVQAQVLHSLSERMVASPCDIAQDCQISQRTVWKHLKNLRSQGIVKRTGRGVYSVTPLNLETNRG